MKFKLTFDDGSIEFPITENIHNNLDSFPYNCKIYTDFIIFCIETNQIKDNIIEWNHKKSEFKVIFVNLILNEQFDYFNNPENYDYKNKQSFIKYLNMIHYKIPFQIKDFSIFIKWIYKKFYVSSVTYDNKTYINQSNSWDNDVDMIDYNDNPWNNEECDGYDECQLINRLDVNNDDVIYNIRHHTNDIDHNDFINDMNIDEFSSQLNFKDKMILYEESIKNIYETIEYSENLPINTIDLKDIIISKNKNITLVNKYHEYDDHRGSDHTKIILKKYDSITLNGDISLYDFIVACFKVKHHKFDLWYELYCNSNLKYESNNIIIELIFDHGS